jgi:hypothetical protein
MIVQCMGGMCGSREDCQHYDAPERPGRKPIERLCGAVEQPEQRSREVAIRPCSGCLSTQTPVATVPVQFDAESGVTPVATNDM